MTDRVLHFRPTAGETQDRIDRWLARLCADEGDSDTAGLSRSQIKRLIVAGCLSCDDKIVTDPSALVQAEGHYCLTLAVPTASHPAAKGEDLPLDILFEDGDIIVINKAAGMVVHPAPGAETGTLVNALIHHCGEELLTIGARGRPGIVHRLDRDTSGVMLAAKSAAAQHALAAMFAAHKVTRQYTALVWRLLADAEFSVDAPIARHPRARKKMAVTSSGRPAITHVKLIRHLPPWASLIRCRLETGRTHQIRVHLAQCGHSVIGDAVYGRRPKHKHMHKDATKAAHALAHLSQFPRQALHATHLGFRHPTTGKPMQFDTPLPDDMAGLLAELEA